MKLTVDASVVVKWFVDEPLSEESRLLLAHRLDLYALLDLEPYLDELAALAEIVEERIDLLALGWFAAKRFNDWPQSLAHAAKTVSFTYEGYVAGYGKHWNCGYERLIHGAPVK